MSGMNTSISTRSGLYFVSLPYSFRAVCGFRAYFDLWIRPEYSSDLPAYEFVMVGNQDTFSHLDPGLRI
jgi:hypothetical protein